MACSSDTNISQDLLNLRLSITSFCSKYEYKKACFSDEQLNGLGVMSSMLSRLQRPNESNTFVKDVIPLPFFDSMLKIIKQPSSLEHTVATLVTTSIMKVFFSNVYSAENTNSIWLITPEQRDEDSNKIPDLGLEKLTLVGQNPCRVPYLFCEFKREGKASTHYQALFQLIYACRAKLKDFCYNNNIYLLVVTGTYVSFWEMDIEAITEPDKNC